jgi:hypothetical protein
LGRMISFVFINLLHNRYFYAALPASRQCITCKPLILPIY